MADITNRVLGDMLHVDPATEHVGDPLSVRREGGTTARDVLADISNSDDGVALPVGISHMQVGLTLVAKLAFESRHQRTQSGDGPG